jgi:predicted nucleotidyltransferase
LTYLVPHPGALASVRRPPVRWVDCFRAVRACYLARTDVEPQASIATGSVDLRPVRALLSRIEAQYHPEQVWLFGSRARGDAGPGSDWDLFVVVPDHTPDEQLDLLFLWRLTRGSGVPADVIACRASELLEACDTVNTLSYVVAKEGVRIDDR